MDEKDRRYKVMTQTTMGSTLFADQAQNLTKEECDKRGAFPFPLEKRGDDITTSLFYLQGSGVATSVLCNLAQ